MRLRLIGVACLLLCGVSLLSAGPLSREEQKKLAESLYAEMTKADEWDLDLFIKNHRRVIDECPETTLAAESCWRLSNLYLTARAKPDRQAAIELMEHLMRQYPNCPLREMAASRYVNTCQAAGEFQKMLQFCQERLAEPKLPKDQVVSYTLWAGEASESLGQMPQAAQYYRVVLQHDPQQTGMLAQAAQLRLSRVESQDQTAPAGK
ncbi:MAG TPA: hypothetical protein PKO06_18660 [Candidatus Ozemobacteraceae bacterium]|nr:hypothetical protein [Candidatus Ozemobacteraceae bacterium]